MLRKDSVRLTRRFDRIERGLQAQGADRRRAELRALFGAASVRPVNASLLFPPPALPPHHPPPAAPTLSPSPAPSTLPPASALLEAPQKL